MRWIAKCVAGGVLALGIAGSAGACLCRKLPPVQMYALATNVVIAKIDSAWVHRETVVLRLPSGNALSAGLGGEITINHTGIRATLDITESLKGAPEDLAFVAPDFSCELRLDLGREYLLFLDARGRVSWCTGREFSWGDPKDVAIVRMLRLFEGRQPPGIVPDRGIEPRPTVNTGSGSLARTAAARRASAGDERRFRPWPRPVHDSRVAAYDR
jgi:hypothetical protein